MLSFLYRLMRSFHREHGYPPNVVFMNVVHYGQLRENLADLSEYPDIRLLLGMEIILSEDCVHPHVGWLLPADRVSTG